MKFVDEYRDNTAARKYTELISRVKYLAVGCAERLHVLADLALVLDGTVRHEEDDGHLSNHHTMNTTTITTPTPSHATTRLPSSTGAAHLSCRAGAMKFTDGGGTCAAPATQQQRHGKQPDRTPRAATEAARAAPTTRAGRAARAATAASWATPAVAPRAAAPLARRSARPGCSSSAP